jgi:beta-lactamase superfamily II metal-dependent hydrolase
VILIVQPSSRLVRGALLGALSALAAHAPAPAVAQSVGERLPQWTAGTLDVHHVNTGRGNATFFQLPDGTTLLVDAGDGGNPPPRGTHPRPDGSRPPAEWIARYVQAMGASAIDYGYLTHFHSDHMNAMVDVAARVPVRTMIDRAFPSYDFPAADHAEFQSAAFQRYRDFVASGKARGLRLRPGRSDQIVLLRDAKAYPQFEARAMAANGDVWTGDASGTTRSVFPPLASLPREDFPTENMSSLATRIRYGAFDYFTGGDMPGNVRPGYPDWQDVETPVAQATGPVDVALLNHHGNRDSQNANLVRTLRPRVWVIHVWSSDHPAHDVLDRMLSARLYPGPRDVFATNMIEANRIVIGPMLDRLASASGHVVVRVAPGGASYRVIVLDDSAETYAVKAVFGPYESR